MELAETLYAQQQVARLQALLEASRQIHSTIELDEVVRTVLQIVVRELELTGAFFTHFHHMYGKVPAHTSYVKGGPPNGDTQHLHLPLNDKAGNSFTELVVLFPADRILSIDEMDFLESLAMQASVAIENARFHERTIEWQRLESDLASARLVQRSLLPQEMPQVAGYTLAARSVTCYEVGGDYLDIITLPSGEIIIVIADVAGKGLASALVSTSFRSAFRAMATSGLSLVDIATRMNVLHYGEGDEARHRYVTAFLLRLDPATHCLEVVNAGHNPAFLVLRDGAVRAIEASGTPVGILPFSSYASESFVLEEAGRLLVYTDGLSEVFHGEEEFGEERLLDTFLQCRECDAAATLASVWKTLDSFSDGQPQTDDMTGFVLLRQE
jgi:serine phosphatase RsbU (regulator of sigma subunit)